MYRTLLMKELREIWWIGLLPLLAMWYSVAVETEFGPHPGGVGFGFRHVTNPEVYHQIPFVGRRQFDVEIVLWGCLLAAALGLSQTFRESQAHTWHFLLHRPVDRSLVLWSKVGAASLIYLVAIIVPLFCTAVWAAIPGTHASPFRWSLTWPHWYAAAAGSALYLAALFAGLRQGHLIGVRWWPLIGAAVWFAVVGATIPGSAKNWMWGPLLVWNVLLVAAVRDELKSADFS